MHVLMRTPDETLFGDLGNVDLEQVDMADFAAITAAVERFQPNAIIHCAASGVRPSRIGWFEQIHLNVSSTVALFHAACDVPNCHFIHISTGLVYSDQDRALPRARSDRHAAPLWSFEGGGGLPAACRRASGSSGISPWVRPFSFTGLHDGGDRLFPSLLRAASEGRSFPMSAGTQIRDFCAVQDVVEGIVMMLEEGTLPGPRHLQSGLRPKRFRCVGLWVRCGRQLGLDVAVEELGALPFHPQEPMNLVADIHLAQSLGWQPPNRQPRLRRLGARAGAVFPASP